MNKRPATELPPVGAPCVLYYEADKDEDDIGAKFGIGSHDGKRWYDANHSGKIDQSWVLGWALIDTAKPPEPPPNTHRVRVVVDVSPLYNQRTRNVRVVKVDEIFDEPIKHLHRRENGWKRSVFVLDSPTPEPMAELVGVLEGS